MGRPGRAAKRARSKPLAVLLQAPELPEFQQARARRSYDALVAAAAELFAKHGFDAVGTPEIAEAAGVSVGTFYRYFDDKREVYLEIMRRMMLEVHQKTIDQLTPERLAGRARHETISMTVALLFELVMSNPALSRSFMEMSLRDPEVGRLRLAFEELAVQRIGGWIAALTPLPDPDAIAYVLYGAALQCMHGLVSQLAPTEIDRARARAALTTVIERALFPA